MILRASTAFIATLLAATPVLAQMHAGHTSGMDMGRKAAAAPGEQTHIAKGTVKKADPKAGKVTLDHGAVASLNWPAMTMAFKVKDVALWKNLADGSKVEVEFALQGADYVVTRVR